MDESKLVKSEERVQYNASPQNRLPEETTKKIEGIRNFLDEAIIGQHDFKDLIMAAMFSDGHVLIEGVPGVAKTRTARRLAQAVSGAYTRIQFTPDLMPSDVTGLSIFNPGKNDFEFRKGPIFANMVLADEINRAPAKTQAALFEAMEEKQVSNDGVTHSLPVPFMVLATQNPIDHDGTYRLPEAQLDRFMLKIVVDYPETHEEKRILQLMEAGDVLKNSESTRAVVSNSDLNEVRAQCKSVHVEDLIFDYVVAIVAATRKHKDLLLGASPRASLALVACAKAMAMLEGRHFVIPEDVRAVTTSVLRHRITLTPEADIDGKTETSILNRIIESVEVPK